MGSPRGEQPPPPSPEQQRRPSPAGTARGMTDAGPVSVCLSQSPSFPPPPPAPCSSSSSISQHKEPARPGPGSCHFVHGVPGGPFRAELAQCGAGGHRGHPSRVPGTNLEGTEDKPRGYRGHPQIPTPPTTAVPVTPRCRAVLTTEERGLGSVPAEGAAGGPAASPRFRGCPPPSPPPHRGRRSL